MVLVMKREPRFNDPENKAVKEWFRVYYVKWMETCENLRWLSSGRGVKHPKSLLPFIPFAVVPSLPYTNLLITFIDTQISHIDETLPHQLGNTGHMASIIEDPCTDFEKNKEPYILVEWCYGGVVKYYTKRNNKFWPDLVRELKEEGTPIDNKTINKKIVKTSFLRELYQLDQKWRVHGDNALYLIDFMFKLFQGINNGDARMDPKMPMLENLDKIKGQIKLHNIDVHAIVKQYAGLLPNLTIEGRGGEIPIHLGGKYTIVLSENALWAFLDGFKLHDNLAGITSYLLAFMEQGLRTGWIKLSGLRWLSKISTWYFKRRVYTLPKKVQTLAKIMANPFRLMLVGNGKAIVLTMKNGLPDLVEGFDLDAEPDEPLKDLWLWACKGRKERQFIHLAIRLKEPPQAKWYMIRPLFDLSFLQRVDFYPKNDYVRFILRKGPLQLICNALLPFLSA
jgi:hypothetical protein